MFELLRVCVCGKRQMFAGLIFLKLIVVGWWAERETWKRLSRKKKALSSGETQSLRWNDQPGGSSENAWLPSKRKRTYETLSQQRGAEQIQRSVWVWKPMRPDYVRRKVELRVLG